jgi:glycerol dehydrogenase
VAVPPTDQLVGSIRLFGAPARYVQGPGALDRVGDFVAGRHSSAVVLVDEALAPALAPRLSASLTARGIDASVVAIGGEVTQPRIEALASTFAGTGATVVVAAGGGKTLDTGKGVARSLGIGVVTVPTIASNDGPTSRVVALYDEGHRLVDTPQIDENPEVVVVDTRLISLAPRRFLVSGIGDAVAKRFEASACARGSGVTSNGTRPLMLPAIIAEGCYRTLVRDGAAALASVDRHEVTQELENVVEAVVLMSGLAFENGGLSLAHSLTRGLMALDGARAHLHGHHVGYGLLVQLLHERDDDAYEEVRAFFTSVGLPLSLRDLDVVPSIAAAEVIARGAMSSPHLANCVPAPSQRSIVRAVEAVEAAA